MMNITSRLCKSYCYEVTKLRQICVGFGNKRSVKSDGRVKPFEAVPGPAPIPLLGSCWVYMPLIGSYSFRKLYNAYENMYYKYGPLVKEKLFTAPPMVHVFEFNDMNLIYHHDGDHPSRSSHDILARYRKERPSKYDNIGLFASNGEEWTKFRDFFGPLVFDANLALTFTNSLEDATEDLVAKIYSSSDSNFEIDIMPELFKWSLECVAVVTLNRRLNGITTESEDSKALIKAANVNLRSIYLTELFKFLRGNNTGISRRYAAAQDIFTNIIDRFIREAKALHEDKELGDCLYYKMLEAKGKDSEIFTMIVDLFLAGIDTTAYTTGFALYNLAKNPKSQEKLRKELVQHLPEKTTRWTGTGVDEAKYLRCMHSETLRLNPVSFANGRILQTDLVLSGYNVPANTMALIHHQAASRQEKYFQQAHRFLPERWLTKPNIVQDMVSSTFGYGVRSCIGRYLATREMILAMGKLVRHFRIEYHHEDVGIKNVLINLPDKPIKLRFIPIDK